MRKRAQIHVKTQCVTPSREQRAQLRDSRFLNRRNGGNRLTRDGGDDLTDESIQVGVGRPFNVEIPPIGKR